VEFDASQMKANRCAVD